MDGEIQADANVVSRQFAPIPFASNDYACGLNPEVDPTDPEVGSRVTKWGFDEPGTYRVPGVKRTVLSPPPPLFRHAIENAIVVPNVAGEVA